jgi:hypothetical protein
MEKILRTGLTAVLLNGVPGDWIPCRNGLRQGTTRYPLLTEGHTTVGYFSPPSGNLDSDGLPSAISRRHCSVVHCPNNRRYSRILAFPMAIIRR